MSTSSSHVKSPSVRIEPDSRSHQIAGTILGAGAFAAGCVAGLRARGSPAGRGETCDGE